MTLDEFEAFLKDLRPLLATAVSDVHLYFGDHLNNRHLVRRVSVHIDDDNEIVLTFHNTPNEPPATTRSP